MSSRESDAAEQPPGVPITTPERALGSIRRTSSFDMTYPEGLEGRIVLEGRARDYCTDASGAGFTVEETTTDVEIRPDGTVRAITSTPRCQGAAELIDLSAGRGFRRALSGLPALAPFGLLRALLDDLPVATMITGYLHARMRHQGGDPPARPFAPVPDVCAGWRLGGAIMRSIETTGVSLEPVVQRAGPLGPTRDPDAWHDLHAMRPGSMRRRRRVDLADGDPLGVDAMVRDTFMDDDGTEWTLHEWHVIATVDRSTHCLLSCVATDVVLPSPADCPRAASAAGQVVGTRVDDLDGIVGTDLRGPVSCTHLNDVIRSIRHTPTLAHRLATSATGSCTLDKQDTELGSQSGSRGGC